MTELRRGLVITGICISIYYLIMIVISFGGYAFFDDIPEPEIKYAEFKFKIIFEINGAGYIYEDVYVCEFDGIEKSEGGIFLKWKTWYKSNPSLTHPIIYSHPNKAYNMVLSLPSADYFMSSPSYEPDDSAFYVTVVDNHGVWLENPFKTEWYPEYHFKIVSWSCEPPIKNTYK